MSKAVKRDSGAMLPGELPFEEAIGRLESIVETMESEDLPLETMISRFEEGILLASHCRTKLSEAELKVLQVEKKASGELTAKPTEIEAPSD